MKFVLVHKGGTEYVELDASHPAKWTFVNEIKNATLFESEREVEKARDARCRFPWIVYRPATETEILKHDTSHSQSSKQNSH